MAKFNERLAEAFVGATGMEGMTTLLSNVQVALRTQFPLCPIDTEAIEERLLGVAEEVSALRRRTAAAFPLLPRINPEPVAIETPVGAEAVEPEAQLEPEAAPKTADEDSESVLVE
jgi:hypothetical protein